MKLILVATALISAGALALSYDRIANGPCRGKIAHDANTGQNFIRLNGTDEWLPLTDETEQRYLECND